MEVETNEYRENRLAAMAELEKLGFRPYGRAYPHDDLAKIREEFEEGKEVSAAGRLLMIRRMGKMNFCTMNDGTDRFQLIFKRDELDERLFATPSIALERCRAVAGDMAICSITALKESLSAITDYTPELAESIRKKEERSDKYEDVIGTYLVKLATIPQSDTDNRESAMLLKAIGDLERISDHSVNVLCSVEELREKKFVFSDSAKKELSVLTSAVNEILDLSLRAFLENDFDAAVSVEPLEQVIDSLKEHMRTHHIDRLRRGSCSIETGFVWSDLLTNLSRTSDHCSNIAGGVIDFSQNTMNIHESLRSIKKGEFGFNERYLTYSEKYSID